MARAPRKITPKPTNDTDWRIPSPSGKYIESLGLVPKNGAWYIMAEGLGLSTAEQTARGLNYVGSAYEFGYHVRADGTDLVSDLAVRWVGNRTTTTSTTGVNP